MKLMRILAIDDDESILAFLRVRLEQDGFEVLQARSGAEGLELAATTLPDLALVDLRLPGMDGFEFSRRLLQIAEIPIIMLTAVADEQTVVEGLERYAEDYVNKPFHYPELRARISRVLARRAPDPTNIRLIIDEHLTVDLPRRTVWVDGEPQRLSPIEARLLSTLLQNRGRVVPQDALLRRAWGTMNEGDPDSLWVRMRNLRRKIGDVVNPPRYVLTERGVGYRFADPPSEPGTAPVRDVVAKHSAAFSSTSPGPASPPFTTVVAKQPAAARNG
ncbi:MAG TPA: response regulator transcription factor [Chloroflexia bacterium]|nr:response regulator transcription factor [Chloroflexia bacterium]